VAAIIELVTRIQRRARHASIATDLAALKIVLIGDQAHGKSALVQALLGCRWATAAGQESARYEC
jgi:translation initiation factor 2 gamma subunit (eIF-2gamma)